MTRAEEQEAIRRVLDGDRNAFEPLLLDNERNVYNLALRMTASEQDAMDVSQDVFLKAYSLLHTFRGECRFSVWLYRITYNICIDRARKNSRYGAVSLEQPDEDGQLTEMEIPDTRSLPEEELLKAEKCRAIRQALDSLTPEHRQAIALREFGDLSYEEMASLLQVSEGTVKSRLNRARQRLGQILVKNGTIPAVGASTKQKEGGNA